MLVYANETPHEVIPRSTPPIQTLEACRDLILSAVMRCVDSDKIQPECVMSCPLLRVDTAIFSEEIALAAESSAPETIAQSVATQTSHWLDRISTIENGDCHDGPISEPHNWGEIDGEPETGFGGYLCSITNTQQ